MSLLTTKLAKGNSFNTRVWPIPAQGRRTVRVSVSDQLDRNGTFFCFPLVFPLKEILAVDFSLHVSIQQCARVVSCDLPLGLRGVFHISHGEGTVSLVSVNAKTLCGKLAITVEPSASVVQRGSDATYFTVNVPVPAELTTSRPETQHFKTALFWDTSRSHLAYFQELDAIKKLYLSSKCEIQLFFFDTTLRGPVILEDCDSIINTIREEHSDGGTDFSCICECTLSGFDLVLLFTDGIQSVPGHCSLKLLQCPVFSFCATPGGNFQFLKALSLETGGAFFDLTKETYHVPPISGLKSIPFLHKVTLLDTSAEACIYPQNFPLPSSSINNITITGRLCAEVAGTSFRLKLDFECSDGAPFSSTVTVVVPAVISAEPAIVARNWARMKLNALEEDSDANAIVSAEQKRLQKLSLCRQYGLLFSGMSFIVLESLDQYLKYDIEPPSSLAILQAQFRSLRHQEESNKLQEKEKIANAVRDWWRSRVLWWAEPPLGHPGALCHSMSCKLTSERLIELPSKVTRKIIIPEQEFPDYNFVGLVVGPRGITKKRLEQQSGASISIHGRGSVKSKTLGPDEEPLHILVTGDTAEQVDQASALLTPLLTPMDDNTNEWKKQQLRELAEINGTLRDRSLMQPVPESYGDSCIASERRVLTKYFPADFQAVHLPAKKKKTTTPTDLGKPEDVPISERSFGGGRGGIGGFGGGGRGGRGGFRGRRAATGLDKTLLLSLEQRVNGPLSANTDTLEQPEGVTAKSYRFFGAYAGKGFRFDDTEKSEKYKFASKQADTGRSFPTGKTISEEDEDEDDDEGGDRDKDTRYERERVESLPANEQIPASALYEFSLRFLPKP